jgi:hypothetical protein
MRSGKTFSDLVGEKGSEENFACMGRKVTSWSLSFPICRSIIFMPKTLVFYFMK